MADGSVIGGQYMATVRLSTHQTEYMTPTRSHGAPLPWVQSCGQLEHDSPASQRPLPHLASVVGGGGGGRGGGGGGEDWR